MINTANQPNIICPYCEHADNEVESVISFCENEDNYTRECEECGNQYTVQVNCKFTTVRNSQ